MRGIFLDQYPDLRKAEDGGQDPRHDEIDARQLLAELDDHRENVSQLNLMMVNFRTFTR